MQLIVQSASVVVIRWLTVIMSPPELANCDEAVTGCRGGLRL